MNTLPNKYYEQIYIKDTSSYIESENETDEYTYEKYNDSNISYDILESYSDNKYNKKLVVIGVATDNNAECKNWKNAIIKNGGIPKLIGVGQKWGGWKWRTEQIVKYLNTQDDNDIFLITDVYDAFLSGDTNNIISLFLEYNKKIVVSCERCYSLQGLQNIRPKGYRNYVELLNQKINVKKYDHLSLNAGQIIGYCKDLKNLYKETQEFMDKKLNDDQSALYNIYFDWLEGKRKTSPFIVDHEQKIFGSIVRDDGCPACECAKSDPLNQWEWDDNKKLYYNTITKNHPPCLHFPGGAIRYYNMCGTQIYGEDFETVSDLSTHSNISSIVSFLTFGLLLITLIILIAWHSC